MNQNLTDTVQKALIFQYLQTKTIRNNHTLIYFLKFRKLSLKTEEKL